MPGKVYLIGAGPGDPGLLTLKGRAILEHADCVIYDFLAAAELLRFCQPSAEKIFAGKRGGGPRRPQDEITALLISKAREGKIVGRLKGGDPFVFGRGGEEALALVNAGIPFEVVPGVTSGIAAPAYAGIPVTHREIASSVSFVAAHDDSPPDLAALGQGTLVFFMGTRNLALIASSLIAQGRSRQEPAAVIHWGTRPGQQVVVGTLEDIAARAAGLTPPTVIIVGEVVKLREQLNWFERLPLFGKRIVITRTLEQAGVLRDALAVLGAEGIEIPTIEIREPASWAPLDRAIGKLGEFQYLLVTSANGVRNFLARLAIAGRDVRNLKGLTIGAIGPATASEFRKSGITVDFVPKDYRAEGLLDALAGRDLRGKSFLIPRAKVARDLVPRALEERGARVEVIEAYETVVPELPPGELELLMNPLPDAITFTSSSTALNLARLFPDRTLSQVLYGVTVASIGPITSDTVRKLGLEVTVEAAESTIPGLVKTLVEFFQRRGR
ncbi:MAG: uroporphyrinogen-III C-methyltransferase [Acidobacteria bacterium]|nr:uroporphyrinogen-III C-methyltransferase [Acidobacteriota bacterium]